jgi:hypothetical protein
MYDDCAPDRDLDPEPVELPEQIDEWPDSEQEPPSHEPIGGRCTDILCQDDEFTLD